MHNSKLSPGNLTILIAGAVMFLASFLPFYTFSAGGFHRNFNAWNSTTWLRGVATLPALFGLIMAAHIVLTTFLGVRLRRRIAGFTWNQVHLLLAFQSVVMMVAFVLRDRLAFGYGTGFALMFVASFGLLVGAIMRDREPITSL